MNKITYLIITLMLFSVPVFAQNKAETNRGLQKLEKWKKTNGEPIVDEEGRLLYAFGESMPQVVCAPLALCDIKMQAGEEIISVRIGDKARWLVNNARSGDDGSPSEHLVVKPTSAGLSTTLFVGTNRRVYVIELLSHATQFMSKVGFLYKDSFSDPTNNTTNANSDIELLPRAELTPTIVLPAVAEAPKEELIEGHEVLAHKLNFKYAVTGPNVVWKPIRVYDDGLKTYIDMDKHKVNARELPIFLNNDTDSRGHMINYRFIPHDARFVVDGIFDKGSLVLGEGRKRVKVKIVREHIARNTNNGAFGE